MADHGELLVPRAAHQGEDVTRPLRAWTPARGSGRGVGAEERRHKTLAAVAGGQGRDFVVR